MKKPFVPYQKDVSTPPARKAPLEFKAVLLVIITMVVGAASASLAIWYLNRTDDGPAPKPVLAPSARPEPVQAPRPAPAPRTAPAIAAAPAQAAGSVEAGAAGLSWVTIQGGMFEMGSNDGNSNERPKHQVMVRTFQITRTEVTVGQYKACVDAGACAALTTDKSCNWGIPGRTNHPVNCVDWFQAVQFATWAGGRLPTEAEWEYAARNGASGNEYPWGASAPTCNDAVFSDSNLGCRVSNTAPICSKPAGNTPLGLCDMSGNVLEWVQDWYHRNYTGAPADGSAWETPADSTRVFRGGSWSIEGKYLRAADRSAAVPAMRIETLGFRVSRFKL